MNMGDFGLMDIWWHSLNWKQRLWYRLEIVLIITLPFWGIGILFLISEAIDWLK